MIKIVKNKNIITLSGHAGRNDCGKDIVCAGVSCIVYTTINAIAKLGKRTVKVIDNEDMVIEILSDDEIVKILVSNMMELLVSLSKEYPKNIIVKEN